MTGNLTTATMFFAVVFGGLFYAHVSAQGRPITVTNIEVEKTRMLPETDTNPSVIERGFIQIAPDGRYRIDRTTKEGDHTAEIVIPAKNQRTVVNYTMKTVTTGSLRSVWVAPTGRPGQPIPAGTPSSAQKDSEVKIPLGTKAIGSVTLEGDRFVTTFTRGGEHFQHTVELWTTVSHTREVLPVLVESRFEGPHEITEQRATNATNVEVANTIFDIPASFRAVEPVH